MQSRSGAQGGLTPANRFRPLIEAAIAAGVDFSHQVLHLTHGDAAKLRRDPAVGDDEISFSSGAMTFLGVRVVEGAPTSAFSDVNGVIVTPTSPPGAVAPTAKAGKKAAKPKRKAASEKPEAAAAAGDLVKSPAKAQ